MKTKSTDEISEVEKQKTAGQVAYEAYTGLQSFHHLSADTKRAWQRAAASVVQWNEEEWQRTGDEEWKRTGDKIMEGRTVLKPHSLEPLPVSWTSTEIADHVAKEARTIAELGNAMIKTKDTEIAGLQAEIRSIRKGWTECINERERLRNELLDANTKLRGLEIVIFKAKEALK